MVCCFQPVEPSYRLTAVPTLLQVDPLVETSTWTLSAFVVYPVSWYIQKVSVTAL